MYAQGTSWAYTRTGTGSLKRLQSKQYCYTPNQLKDKLSELTELANRANNLTHLKHYAVKSKSKFISRVAIQKSTLDQTYKLKVRNTHSVRNCHFNLC